MSALDVIVITLKSFLISLKQFKVDKAVEKSTFPFQIFFSGSILTASQLQSSFEDARKHNTFRRPLFLPVSHYVKAGSLVRVSV